jgi:AraC-like DNA-binding protein
MDRIRETALLRRQLLDRLRPLATAPGRPRKEPGRHDFARSKIGSPVLANCCFTYCCFTAERLAQVEIVRPLIGIVLAGAKEFWRGDQSQRFTAGDVFVSPGGATLDVVNIPDDRHGLYESLLVEVARLPASIARLPDLPPVPKKSFDMRVTLTADLVDALAHAATTLATSSHAAVLGEHRLAEVLMLLRSDPAARPLFEVPLADRIRWMVASDPTRRWTADELARRLGVGASTLRRRLTAEGTPLRAVLATARMGVAQDMLARGDSSVTAAAEAAGYSSRSHFTRRFRSVYGSTPGERRLRRAG